MSETIKTDGKTNSEIFTEWRRSAGTTRQFLTSLQKQVGFLMEQGLQRRPCPNCGEPHNLPEAAGNVPVDKFDFGEGISDRMGPCRSCGRTLVYTLPMLGGNWHWRLDPTEARTKEKSK